MLTHHETTNEAIRELTTYASMLRAELEARPTRKGTAWYTDRERELESTKQQLTRLYDDDVDAQYGAIQAEDRAASGWDHID